MLSPTTTVNIFAALHLEQLEASEDSHAFCPAFVLADGMRWRQCQ
jgi:hypothetical protein